MSAYDIAAALLTAINECVNADCRYDTFISMGQSPAPVGTDCKQISAYTTGFNVLDKNSFNGCVSIIDESVTFLITHCCADPDMLIGENFNGAVEDKQAECFIRDVEAIYCCLNDNAADVLQPFGRINDNYLLVSGIAYDMQRMGGCYSAKIMINYKRR